MAAWYWRPARGLIKVVLVQEESGWLPFFCTDANATVVEIAQAVSDRAAIEQNFRPGAPGKEVKETGQQQVRNIWANLGASQLNMWAHSLIEQAAWGKSKQETCDRSACPWDDPERRPSHADRLATLQRQAIEEE